MSFIILTGISGSGKSTAVKFLEDIGYFCVDNLPPYLLSKFAEISIKGQKEDLKTAVVVDVRSGNLFNHFEDELDKIKALNIKYDLVFIDADDEIIRNRYEETRRKHPLLYEMKTIEDAISEERKRLSGIRERADYVLDTDNLSIADFKKKLTGFFGEKQVTKAMKISCISFGFKRGAPKSADLQFDVRCLKNPFYVPVLKRQTGLNTDVKNYIMEDKNSQEYKKKVFEFLDFVLPLYVKEGKTQLTIAFGCTGGKHRSVLFAEMTAEYLNSKGYSAFVIHRDIEK